LVGVSLSQERSFELRLSGRENLLFFARIRNARERDARGVVDSLIEELQLEQIAPVLVGQCSSGMVQQLTFARALLGEPPALLLDEPTRSLDDDARERLWAALDRRRTLEVLLATHPDDDAELSERTVQLGD
jgi:ABC-2 type transport system ATP-binding protein